MSDVTVSNNTIHDTAGGFSMNGVDESVYPLLRFKVYNNLLYNLNGNLCIYYQNCPGPAWYISSGFAREDAIISHNTFCCATGSVPSFQFLSWQMMEGFSARDNLIWVDSGTTGINFAGGEEVQGWTGSCVNLTGKAALDCAFTSGLSNPSYDFSNVVIPAGVNTQSNLQTIYGSLLTAAQVPANPAAVGWVDAAHNNYRLRSTSAFISGGRNATDGLDVGVNQDILEDAQGLIKNVRALNITSTGAAIAFHAPDSDAACYVAYGTGPTGTWTPNAFNPLTWSVSPADRSAHQERSIGLSGLSAKTEYFYQVWCAGTAPTTTLNLRTR